MKADKTILTIEEAAGVFHVSKTTVRNAIKRGQIQAVKGGIMGNRTVGVTVASVNAIIDYRRKHHAGEMATN